MAGKLTFSTKGEINLDYILARLGSQLMPTTRKFVEAAGRIVARAEKAEIASSEGGHIATGAWIKSIGFKIPNAIKLGIYMSITGARHGKQYWIFIRDRKSGAHKGEPLYSMPTKTGHLVEGGTQARYTGKNTHTIRDRYGVKGSSIHYRGRVKADPVYLTAMKVSKMAVIAKAKEVFTKALTKVK